MSNKAANKALMLSPKMQRIQRAIRINDGQLLGLAEKARYDARLSGYLYKRCSDSNKWLLRWFRLYQNLLFYYDNDNNPRPNGVIFLEGCYCERILTPPNTGKEDIEKIYCFAIMYRRENQRQYELRAKSLSECQAWIDGIKMASWNKLHLQMEELEQKHLHLLQVVESEKTAKWQYTQHCDDLTEEIKKLRSELFALKKEWRLLPQMTSKSSSSSQDGDKMGGCGMAGFGAGAGGDGSDQMLEDPDISKIKKVQSFFRGWLCRRRWKQIVEEYIRSPHAESMRKRNCLVFRMVEAEEEYVEQLEILISCFLRPFKMAASSKNPPCSHEDINSIFLNSETVLFLHQIFLKGLTARMESWPTLVLGDLFDMLLPMLSIYQEYVRNHHYCLQVLTECKQIPGFASLLQRLEKKPACKGRSLETFLTYPMHQIPRYIITLHELLAHTPPDHVEKKSLEHARKQLEDLSRQMHDEVSETENIRKNLAIERMIVEGCDILLDVNQMFVRQGTLIQIMTPSSKSTSKNRFSSNREKEREAVRQCFLFSNHLIITTRTHGGRLHLVEGIGKIPLADITLIEDPNDDDRFEENESPNSSESGASLQDVATKNEQRCVDFKLIVDDVKTGQQNVIHLVAPTRQEKDAWVTDISQCMDNVHFNGLFYNTTPNASSSTLPQCVKSDPNLFKDDVDIRFSKTFNTCKIPQIRYATPEKLLQRLTDLRFLNIDFLNTFLLTYRVFTDGITVLDALKKVFYNPEPPASPTSSSGSLENLAKEDGVNLANLLNPTEILTSDQKRRISTCSGYSTATDNAGRHGSISPRRISGASSVSMGYFSSNDDHYHHRAERHSNQHWRYSFRRYEEEQRDAGNMSTENHMSTILGGSGCRKSCLTPGGFGSFGGRKNSHDSVSSGRSGSIISGLSPGGRKNSHDSNVSGRSGSIVSSSHQWRKESVTIIEHINESDDVKDGDGETDNNANNEERLFPTSLKAKQPNPAKRSSSMGEDKEADNFLNVPKPMTASSSAETLTDNTLTAPSTPTTIAMDSNNSIPSPPVAVVEPQNDANEEGSEDSDWEAVVQREDGGEDQSVKQSSLAPNTKGHNLLQVSPDSMKSVLKKLSGGGGGSSSSSGVPPPKPRGRSTSTFSTASYAFQFEDDDGSDMVVSRSSRSQPCSHHPSFSSPSGSRALFGGIHLRDLAQGLKSPTKKRRGLFQRHLSNQCDSSDSTGSPISSPQHSKMGVVVTSSRQAHRSNAGNAKGSSKRNKREAVTLEYLLSELSDEDNNSWSSSANAAVAFAVATAGSGNPPDPSLRDEFKENAKRKCSITSNVSTMRVLSVLRHWVTKHTQDFESNPRLKSLTIEFLEDIVCTPTLLPSEHRASSQLLRMLTKEDANQNRTDLKELLAPKQPSKENIITLSALEVAEQMTYLDQQILFAIHSSEFLGQAWAKQDKEQKAYNICLMTRRFNEMSRLVVSDIITQPDINSRVQVIEKWTAVADICRCLHNFNGVLQVCAAFTNSSVYRLKNTWNRVSKSTRQTVDKLQSLVSSDGRFRNLRDALHRTDPPCIPYLGMYLSDLTFIEEGTPNFTDNGLLNFAKMRMIAHVIREIRQFQQTPYKIEMVPRVINFVLDCSKHLDDDELYQRSLQVEPRSSRLSSSFSHLAVTAAIADKHHE